MGILDSLLSAVDALNVGMYSMLYGSESTSPKPTPEIKPSPLLNENLTNFWVQISEANLVAEEDSSRKRKNVRSKQERINALNSFIEKANILLNLSVQNGLNPNSEEYQKAAKAIEDANQILQNFRDKEPTQKTGITYLEEATMAAHHAQSFTPEGSLVYILPKLKSVLEERNKEEKNIFLRERSKSYYFLSEDNKSHIIERLRKHETDLYNFYHQPGLTADTQQKINKVISFPSQTPSVVTKDNAAYTEFQRKVDDLITAYAQKHRVRPNIHHFPSGGIYFDPSLKGKAAEQLDKDITAAQVQYFKQIKVNRSEALRELNISPKLQQEALAASSIHQAATQIIDHIGLHDRVATQKAGLETGTPLANASLQNLKQSSPAPGLRGIDPESQDFWVRHSNARIDIYGDAVASEAQNIRVGLAKDKDGNPYVMVTDTSRNFNTFWTSSPPGYRECSEIDTEYWKARAAFHFAPVDGRNAIKVELPYAVETDFSRAAQAQNERALFAAAHGDEKDSLLPIIIPESGGTSHREIFKIRQNAILAGSTTPSADVFLAIHKDFEAPKDDSVLGTIKSALFTSKKEDYQEWLIKAFTESRSITTQVNDITNFTVKVQQELNNRVANRKLPQEDAQRYMSEWYKKIKDEKPEVADKMLSEMQRRLDIIGKEMDKAQDPAKAHQLYQQAYAIHNIISNDASISTQHKNNSVHKLNNMYKKNQSKIQGYEEKVHAEREAKTRGSERTPTLIAA